MSDLICLAFKELDTADRFLNELRALEKEHVLELEDACVVVRDGDGKIHLKQSVNLVAIGASRGASLGMLMGTLVGLLFMNPLAGFLAGGLFGAGSGALQGKLADYGIDDNFIKSLSSAVEPNSSAIFLLVRKAVADKVMPRLSHYDATVLKTSLTDDQEERLKAALSQAT
ncbi:MAG TPA: DUF1269 domain-containing protein [Candidatus Accumulibacter phosphatis]|nr:MAG: putative membrane protein [Candidatus Accumulibacter sp. SK-11]HAY29196.1 DUF1269 domain-containing protein [Accumulibacter sp.]HCN68883.1 DUF1269 domain-containing protein [Accumulibacter sp.]HRL77651.1 DUF1269 domain-containing protein [Candidatus Accumulibacter phosphatis]HRQ96159.1 DUF1269 domain-containing protein [Candidatus Accumulibacter phosphatis]